MFSAAISGRALADVRALLGDSSTIVPVEKLRMTGQRLRTSSLMRANVAGEKVGEPSSLRAWMCTTAAPAS